MDAQVFYLEAKSAFHLGQRGIGIEEASHIAHADTVFSALCSAYREWYSNGALRERGLPMLEEFQATFEAGPPFLLTSAYPYARLPDGSTLRVFARPLGAPPGLLGDDLPQLKMLKKVELISDTLFWWWVRQDRRLLDELPQGEQDTQHFLHDKRVWLTREEVERIRAAQAGASGKPLFARDQTGRPLLWGEETVPRVSVDRVSSASNVFQAGRIRFAPGGGLWLAFCWRSVAWSEALVPLLQVLGDAGLGGERSAGHGQFRVAGDEWISGLPDEGSRFVTLAPYWPRQIEAAAAFAGEVAYSLIIRRGWMHSPESASLRRQAVRMAGEGSVLAWPGTSTPGAVVDVTPDVFKADRATYPAWHPVWRYGHAFPIWLAGG